MAIKNTNNRIGTPTNLETGGTYDILMIMYPNGFPEGGISFGIDTTPRKVTGVQKVAQTFIKLLMTSKGSNVIYPDQGTSFSSLAIGSNILLDDAVLIAELTDTINDASAQTIKSLNTIGTDEASMLSRVDLAGVDVGDDSVTMFVLLTTVAGITANVAIPFPQLDLT